MKKKIRQLQRYRTISSALARNGFGFIVHSTSGVNAFTSTGEMDWHTAGKHIRQLLEELGATFIKLGQLASTRPDLIPQPILKEMVKLQDAVAPFPYDEVSRVIEEELGSPISQIFRTFESIPMASASIGQVHRAVLADGKKVAVKIQRPQLAALIETDLEILADLARLADRRGNWTTSYNLTEVVEELSQSLLAELDYRQEAAHLEHFARTVDRTSHVRIPDVYRPYSSQRVLTMEYIEGIRITNTEQLKEQGIRTHVLAERIVGTIFQQILIDGVFHADPHPGNILILPDEEFALLDFGMVGRLSAHTQKHFASFIIALRNKSSKGVMRAIEQLGMIPEEADRKNLYMDVDKMRVKYYEIPLKQVRLGEMLNDLFGVAYKHHIRIPSELTMVGKSILTIEGVVAELDPDFSMFNVAEPIGKKMYLERLNPWRLLKDTFEDIPEYLQIASELPATMKRMIRMLNKGEIQVEIDSPQLELLVRKLDRMSNQMSFSIVLLALSLMLLGLIIGSSISGTQTILWRLPMLEIGVVVSCLMFIWLLYAIFRSGRF